MAGTAFPVGMGIGEAYLTMGSMPNLLITIQHSEESLAEIYERLPGIEDYFTWYRFLGGHGGSPNLLYFDVAGVSLKVLAGGWEGAATECLSIMAPGFSVYPCQYHAQALRGYVGKCLESARREYERVVRRLRDDGPYEDTSADVTLGTNIPSEAYIHECEELYEKYNKLHGNNLRSTLRDRLDNILRTIRENIGVVKAHRETILELPSQLEKDSTVSAWDYREVAGVLQRPLGSILSYLPAELRGLLENFLRPRIEVKYVAETISYPHIRIAVEGKDLAHVFVDDAYFRNLVRSHPAMAEGVAKQIENLRELMWRGMEGTKQDGELWSEWGTGEAEDRSVRIHEDDLLCRLVLNRFPTAHLTQLRMSKGHCEISNNWVTVRLGPDVLPAVHDMLGVMAGRWFGEV